MNRDQIEGAWKQVSVSVRGRWAELTEDDWEAIGGQRAELIGRIQVRYGVATAEAEKQVDEWLRVLAESGHERYGADTRRAGTQGNGGM